MFCVNCGSQNHSEARFCNSCGKPTNPSQSVPLQAIHTAPAVQAYAAKLAPQPMKIDQAIKSAFTKFAVFKGRASRSEYWYFALFANVTPYLLIFVGEYLQGQSTSYNMYRFFGLFGYAALAIFFASIIPSLACAVRRLHDTSHSGGAIFLSLIPIVGPIILIVWLSTAGEPFDNKYGPASI
jgi:uncharacterized membrane protein YhaH (DUF805 family)